MPPDNDESPRLFQIERSRLDDPAARALISALNDELERRYPEQGSNHTRLDHDEVSAGRGAFVVGFAGGRPVACGAVRRLDAATAEIKRMFVEPAERGRGYSRRILERLEGEARSLGVTRLVLETGTRQPEAISLYVSHGFAEVPLFGEYVGTPHSVCFAKTLA